MCDKNDIGDPEETQEASAAIDETQEAAEVVDIYATQVLEPVPDMEDTQKFESLLKTIKTKFSTFLMSKSANCFVTTIPDFGELIQNIDLEYFTSRFPESVDRKLFYTLKNKLKNLNDQKRADFNKMLEDLTQDCLSKDVFVLVHTTPNLSNNQSTYNSRRAKIEQLVQEFNQDRNSIAILQFKEIEGEGLLGLFDIVVFEIIYDES